MLDSLRSPWAEAQGYQQGLPANVEAERSILGGILLENLSFEAAAEAGLEPEDFSMESHRRIYRCIQELRQGEMAVDLVTLSEELHKRKELEAVGGAAYISGLTDGVPRRASIRQHVGIVRDKSRLRGLIHLLNKHMAIALEQTESASYILSGAAEDIMRLHEGAVRNEVVRLSDCGPAFLAELETLRGRKQGEILGLTSGLKKLDEVTTGFRRGEFIVLGAFTGRGKTCFAMGVVLRNAGRGVPIGVFSVEMRRDELLGKAVAYLGGIPYEKIRDPRYLSPEELRMVSGIVADAEHLPIYLDDSAEIEIGELIARARLMVRRHKVQLLVVDHLHLVSARRTRDRREAVTAVAQALSRLAKSTGVPVLALAQLGRPKDRDLNERPTLFHLKESGDIEQNANLVLLLHHPLDEETNQPTGEDDIIIAKQRAGIVGHVWARFNTAFQQWMDR